MMPAGETGGLVEALLRERVGMPTLNDVLLMAASQGLLLCVVILSLPSANPIANRLLTVFVGFESLHLFLLHLHNAHAGESPALLLRLLFCLRLLEGPTLYLYVRALTEPAFRIDLRQLRHLWVLCIPLGWFVWLAADPQWRAMSTQELQTAPSTIFMSASQSLILFGYSYVARRRLAAHDHRLQQVLAEVDALSLRWLKWLTTALLVVAAGHLLLDLLRLGGVIDARFKYLLNLGETMALIYVISIGGLRQPKVFTEPVRAALTAIDARIEPAPEAIAGSGERAKYLKSGLDPARADEIAERLRRQLDAGQVYLDPALDLPGLARQLAVRPQELSEVISTRFGSNFYELVNRCRVDAAARLLQEPGARKRKMLDIALTVGFSSQSTFYGQFKKWTGKTPMHFRDAAHHGSAARGAKV
jgi:AraC-like DNA-binding protein